MNAGTKNIVYIALSGVLMATTLGVLILTANINNDHISDNATIVIGDNESKKMSCDIEGLNPGDQSSYFVELKSKNDGDFNLTSSINNQEGGLFNYISLEVVFENKSLFGKEMLKDYVNNPRSFELDLKHGEAKSVEYIFSIDSSFGNDVENLSTSFDCLIELKRII